MFKKLKNTPPEREDAKNPRQVRNLSGIMRPAASGSGKPVGQERPFQGKNRPLKPSLEAVHRTEDDLVAVRGGAFLVGLFKLFL